MENHEAILTILALLMGTSWASGINLYAVLLVLGLGGVTGYIELPPELSTLENPLVIGAAGIMYFVEFFVDKIPGADSVWDAAHTFIRIPAGAMLAVGTVGDVTPALEVAAGILGGTIAATSHTTKSSARLLINTSPEPVTNWSASISEDMLVVGGLWVSLNYPLLFLALFVVFIVLVIWLLPKFCYLIKQFFIQIRKLIKPKQDTFNRNSNSLKSDEMIEESNHLTILQRLQQLRYNGMVTEAEFLERKNKLLEKRLN
ncbi:MAG TPA: DUF4126 family protein [Nitrosomonas sp.]|nr:DUF4126 family protein [Nitrosomonas sp.]